LHYKSNGGSFIKFQVKLGLVNFSNLSVHTSFFWVHFEHGLRSQPINEIVALLKKINPTVPILVFLTKIISISLIIEHCKLHRKLQNGQNVVKF